jgi:hypothetical protein
VVLFYVACKKRYESEYVKESDLITNTACGKRILKQLVGRIVGEIAGLHKDALSNL